MRAAVLLAIAVAAAAAAGPGEAYLHRAEAAWKQGDYRGANDLFRAAVAAEPDNAHYRVRWGRLFLERFQPADAKQLFEEALELDGKNAEAYLGLALAAAESFERAAVELAQKALEIDPKLVEAIELLARLALEDGDHAGAAKEADRALALDPKALGAMAIRLAIDLLEDRSPSPWMERIAAIDPQGGEAWAEAGRHFILNRRYEEGVALYRKAIERNPRLWRAHSELGINLMRLGENEEARRHLELAYANDYRNAATVNTLRLLDSFAKFDTIRSGNVILKLHKKESALLRPYVEAEIRRAMAVYQKKYGIRLERPVQVEMYPDHEDFAVRTLGMPGLGALGVAFGYVVAMDSPSGRKPGTYHWGGTLWHELSHVYVLAATKHRVPRWFTEGLAVHEERTGSPEWADRLDPQVIAAMREKKLLPLRQLDRGFVRPSYPGQVVVSYFQAGRICDFIHEKWGFEKLNGMIRAFAAKKTTPEVVEAELGMTPEEFDKLFFAWLQGQHGRLVQGFDEWRGGMKRINEAARQKRWDEVLLLGPKLKALFPDYVEAGSAYELLAEAWLARDEKQKAAEELEAWARAGGRSPLLLKKLASLYEEAGRRKEAAAALERILYIAPVGDEELHRRLGELNLALGRPELAIRDFQALLHSNPADRADGHFRLALAFQAARRAEDAKEQVLMALEAAPGYKPAQKLLLELSK